MCCAWQTSWAISHPSNSPRSRRSSTIPTAGRRRAAAAAAARPLKHRRDGDAAVLPGFFGELQRIIGDYGYWAVALGILLEDFGMPTPGETLLITGAIVASAGALNIYVLLFLAWLGAVVGDNIG